MKSFVKYIIGAALVMGGTSVSFAQEANDLGDILYLNSGYYGAN